MKVLESNTQVIKPLYLALQYLSNAARCYIPKQLDGSHLDIRYNFIDQVFSVMLSESPKRDFTFNYGRLTLEWTNNRASKIMRLNGAKHKDVISWIRKAARESGYEKTYSYVVPDKKNFCITSDYINDFYSLRQIEVMMTLRSFAHNTMNTLLSNYGIDDKIYLKPYTLTSCVQLKDVFYKGASVDFGFAIPDQFCQDHYYYIKCYGVKRILYVTNMKSLKRGYWVSNQFHGAILPASNVTKEMVAVFLEETRSAFKNKLNKRAIKSH